MTTRISIRATVLYPAGVYPHLDQWAKHVATCFSGEFVASGLDRNHRDLVFDFASADRIGAFIVAVESNPGCSVMIGKPPVLVRDMQSSVPNSDSVQTAQIAGIEFEV